MNVVSHDSIRQSLLTRIQNGEWELGARIPDEVDLAEAYGCARMTINRAMRALADEGIIIRKRKGGTRINPVPVRQAKLDIPILREQVEASGETYILKILAKSTKPPPLAVRNRLNLPVGQDGFYLETLHCAGDKPYAFEVRWINPRSVPEIANAPLEEISANEWLVKTVPFSSGDVAFGATNADAAVAKALDAEIGSAVFVIDRTTWLRDDVITTMKLFYQPGYQLQTRL